MDDCCWAGQRRPRLTAGRGVNSNDNEQNFGYDKRRQAHAETSLRRLLGRGGDSIVVQARRSSTDTPVYEVLGGLLSAHLESTV